MFGTWWIVCLFLFILTSIVSAPAFSNDEYSIDDNRKYYIDHNKVFSVATFELGLDSENGRNSFYQLDLVKASSPRFVFAAGNGEIPLGNGETNTTNYMIGLYSNPQLSYEAGIDYSYWGNDTDINTETTRLTMGWHADWFSFLLQPQTRNIKFYFNSRFPQLPNSFETESNGIGLSFSYYGLSPWQLTAGYLRQSYEHDVSKLAGTGLVNYIFTPATLDLAFGFEKDRWDIDISMAMNRLEPGVIIVNSRSAVDNVTVVTKAIYARYQLSQAWQLQIQFGNQNSDGPGDQILFSIFSLNHRW